MTDANADIKDCGASRTVADDDAETNAPVQTGPPTAAVAETNAAVRSGALAAAVDSNGAKAAAVATDVSGATDRATDAKNAPPPWLAAHRWKPGQSGNPSGRPREAGSLAAALRRVGLRPAGTRAELTKIARQLGMNPDEARNIDVIAGLVYDGIIQLLIRTIKGQSGAGDKLVGLLQILLKALDGDERRITIAGPGELHSALASVSAVLGFRASMNVPSPMGASLPRIPPHSADHTTDDDLADAEPATDADITSDQDVSTDPDFDVCDDGSDYD
ncbi:MAG: hypothetical protein HOP29_13935 [Phycisphaerales bacterium]|nr:hypothetical protein [Phycisphaerales bacterium]